MPQSYHCITCGELHDDLPFSWGAAEPARVGEIAESERGTRVEVSSDQCIIDASEFFILGRIEIPVQDSEHNFYWLAWVSISESDFERASELWDTPGRESEPSYACRVQSDLPYSTTTLNLKGTLRTQPLGDRPLIKLEPEDHPLVVEQRYGITIARVQEIAEQCMHGSTTPLS